MRPKHYLIALCSMLLIICDPARVYADDKGLTAAELATSLSTAVEDGDSYTRLRVAVRPSAGGNGSILQLQVKARRSSAKAEVVYQLLFPKERKGEAFLLSKARSGSAAGFVLSPPTTISNLNSSNMKDAIFGSDLFYEDVIENFFRWDKQNLTGTEKIGRIECLILESKPGANNSTIYGSVRSWIDPKKLVPMRVEKYTKDGKLAVRIETDRVSRNDRARHVPSRLIVQRTGSNTITEVEGSDIAHSMNYVDKDFSVEGLTDLKVRRR